MIRVRIGWTMRHTQDRGSCEVVNEMPESDEVSGSSTTEVDRWPLRSYLELGALPTAVPWARWHARQVACEWGLDGLTETIELLVSDSLNLSICSLGPFLLF
jgi:hypothetical protein